MEVTWFGSKGRLNHVDTRTESRRESPAPCFSIHKHVWILYHCRTVLRRGENLMKKWFVIALLVPVVASFAFAQTGTKKRRPLPYEYGGVVIKNFSSGAGVSPVQFDHWLHRAKYTCRLCHVDIGFAMKANTTGIKAADNMKGYYCGTCHNGKMTHGDRKIFEACATKYTKEDLKRCNRCHSKGENVQHDYDFAAFTERLPKERFRKRDRLGESRREGLIKPLDYIEGVSIKRPAPDRPEGFRHRGEGRDDAGDHLLS